MNDNSLLIGKLIYKLLSNDEALTDMVGKKVFPLVANADTTFPFVVYSRTGLKVDYCKDGTIENEVEVQVLAVSDNYVTSLEIANQVRRILELFRYKDDELVVTQSKLSSVQEEYLEDAFIQRLIFTLNIK